jgi:hypothetical protein
MSAIPPLIPGEFTEAFGAVTKQLRVYDQLTVDGDITMTSTASVISVSGSTILNGLTTSSLKVTGASRVGALTATGLAVAGGSVAVTVTGTGLKVAEGLNSKQGTVTLSGGSAVVTNSSVTASSRIFMTAQSSGAPGTCGALFIVGKVAGSSFTIGSTGANDSSTVAYEIFEPA